MAILIILGTMALGFLAQAYVKSMFHRFSRVGASSGYTGAEVAQEILMRNGVRGVAIQAHDGFLGDHYDPLHRRVVLSQDVFHGRSLSALGVAAHEVGHALQHHQGYLPLQVRSMAVGATTFANQLVLWVPMLGMFGHFFDARVGLMLMAVGWGVIMLFNLVTLPVEFDASRRAKDMLMKLGMVRTNEELRGVSLVLNAAALTYVAAFVTSLLYVLYYLLPLLLSGGRSRNDEDR
jgi:Zn-dependent membrane protease YugP